MKRLLWSLLVGIGITTVLISVVFARYVVSLTREDVLPASSPQPLSTQPEKVTATNNRSPVPIVLASVSDAAYDGSWKPVDGNAKATRTLVEMVNEELSKYDRDFLNNIGLQRVIIANDLVVSGQYRSGMPEAYINEALILDANSRYVNAADGYMRRVIHHELLHFMEYNRYGTFTRRDANWLSCGTNDYGKGGASMYSNPSYANALHPKQGFITGYATSAIEEDKAEVFAYYMTDSRVVQDLAEEDSALKCKVDQTAALL